jgi:phytol kinase
MARINTSAKPGWVPPTAPHSTQSSRRSSLLRSNVRLTLVDNIDASGDAFHEANHPHPVTVNAWRTRRSSQAQNKSIRSRLKPKQKTASGLGSLATQNHRAGYHDGITFGGTRWQFHRLSATEVRRRLWHMTPGLLPLALWLIPHRDPWGPILCGAMLAIVVGIALLMIREFGKIARKSTEQGMGPVLSYALVTLGTLLLLPGKAEIGFATLGILAFGDGSATLAGLTIRGPALPWNQKKTWSGLLAFVLFGGLWSAVLYWGEARPAIPFVTCYSFGLGCAIAAALVESFPGKTNDNLRVGVTATIVGCIMQTVLVGW